MPPCEENYDEGGGDGGEKDYDDGGENEEDIMIIRRRRVRMIIASMARCLITTRVRHTPRSLLEPGNKKGCKKLEKI